MIDGCAKMRTGTDALIFNKMIRCFSHYVNQLYFLEYDLVFFNDHFYFQKMLLYWFFGSEFDVSDN